MNLQTSNLNPSAPVESNAPTTAEPGFVPSWQRFRGFLVFAAVLAAVFYRPLWELLKFAPHKELYSHILLIPFISGYLVWSKRQSPVPVSRPNRALAIVPLFVGVPILGLYRYCLLKRWAFETEDYLAVMT